MSFEGNPKGALGLSVSLPTSTCGDVNLWVLLFFFAMASSLGIEALDLTGIGRARHAHTATLLRSCYTTTTCSTPSTLWSCRA
jgi:hypothetical protein